jgi:hypothetical protein
MTLLDLLLDASAVCLVAVLGVEAWDLLRRRR